MATALDLIKSSLRLIRVIDAEETPSAGIANQSLFALNAFLGQLSAQTNALYQSSEITIPLTINDGEYTVGSTGDITTAITKIESAYVRDNNTDLELLIWTESEYQSIPDKSSGGTPIAINYERGSSVRLWPIPSTAGLTLRIVAMSPFSTLTLQSTISYPIEYTDYIRFGLSRRLALEFGAVWGGEHETQWRECEQVVKTMNLSQTLSPAKFDIPGGQNSGVWFRKVNFTS